MKKIIIFWALSFVGTLLMNANNYQVIGIRGRCEIRKGNSWQPLNRGDIIASPFTVRGVENDATISILDLKTNKGFKIPLPKNSPVEFSPKESSVTRTFLSFLLTPTKAIKLSAQHGGHTTKGNCDFPCDSISASLFAKIGRKFEVKKITSAISDYDVYMRIDEVQNSAEKRFTIFNLSEDTLYIVILKVSKENSKNIQSFYGNSLLQIESNSITELPETEIESAFDYILLAVKEEFIIEDLLNSITSNCDCTLKSDMPIGIYQVE